MGHKLSRISKKHRITFCGISERNTDTRVFYPMIFRAKNEKMLYLSSPNIKEYVDEYDKCWNKSVEILDNYLIIQTNLLLKVQEVDRAVYSMELYDKQHLILTQNKDLSINKNDEKLDNEIEQAAFGGEQQKIIQVQCNKEIADLVEKLKKLTDGVVMPRTH